MKQALTKYQLMLADMLASTEQQPVMPLAADKWIVSSALQKAIRRSAVETAQRAALTFYQMAGPDIWRRFLIIVSEDVGGASVETMALTAAICQDAAWRKHLGDPVRLVLWLAKLLAESPKDRSTDYLICAARDHHSLEPTRQLCARLSIPERLAIVSDISQPLPIRAVAAWYASGLEWDWRRPAVGRGDQTALMQTYLDLGVPEPLVAATRLAMIRAREPITCLAPLVWQEAERWGCTGVLDIQPPKTRYVNNIPLYALDRHTRLGKRAIEQFATECAEVRGCLETHVPANKRKEAAYTAAFYTDGHPVRRRFAWRDSLALEVFGIESDMSKSSIIDSRAYQVIRIFQSHLPELHGFRTQLLAVPSPFIPIDSPPAAVSHGGSH